MNTLMPALPRNDFLTPFKSREADFFSRFFDDFHMPGLWENEEKWIPAIDVSETEKEYFVKAELPGLKKEDIDLTMSDGVLTITGEKKKETREEKKENYHFTEMRYGSFSRSFRLPDDVAVDKADAGYKDGVLTVTVPKAGERNSKKVKVH